MNAKAKPESPTVERTTLSLDGELTRVAKQYAKREFLSFTGCVEKALTQLLTREGMLPASEAGGVEDLVREAVRAHGPDAVKAKLSELIQAALAKAV